MTTQTVKRKAGTIITLGTNSDTHVLTMKNLATATYRQSDKIDFGAAWDQDWRVECINKFGSAPTAGLTMDLWMGYSDNATAGTNNQANLTGADAAYTGYSSDAANSVKQLDFLGSLVLVNNAGPQRGLVQPGWFRPAARYGCLVWLNGSGQTTTNVDADHKIRLIPSSDDIQAAA